MSLTAGWWNNSLTIDRDAVARVVKTIFDTAVMFGANFKTLKVRMPGESACAACTVHLHQLEANNVFDIENSPP